MQALTEMCLPVQNEHYDKHAELNSELEKLYDRSPSTNQETTNSAAGGRHSRYRRSPTKKYFKTRRHSSHKKKRYGKTKRHMKRQRKTKRHIKRY